MSDQVYRALDNSEFTTCILLDLSEHFDTLNRDILLNKLEHYDGRWNAKKLFVSYLSNRKQYAQTNESYSELLSIGIGASQGSNIFSLLFIIYL